MSLMKRIRRRLLQMNRIAGLAFKLGPVFMLLCYITAEISRLSAPYVSDYFYAMSLYSGALEAAPACLAVGVIAGFLGDLILPPSESDDGADES